ncbi:MAG: hypothetical protein AAF687_10685, partial [Pseudomonadota bacterium]
MRILMLGAVSFGAMSFAAPALANDNAETVAEAASEVFGPVDEVATAPATVTVAEPNDSAAVELAPPPNPTTPVARAPAPPPAAPPSDPVKLKIVASQFVDLPVSGDAADTVRYSGRVDGYLNIGGSQFGLDDSVTLTVRPEFTWGETSNGAIGLIPNNTALFRPEGAGDFDVSVSLSKKWKSGAELTVGKVNILDISGALPIVASDGHYGFQNLGLALPPTAVVPNTITGALLQVPTKKVIYRLWVFDPDSQYERTGFETAFESGVGFLASAALRTRIGGMPGIYNFAVVGSTRNQFAVDILPRALTPPPQPFGTFGNESGELALQLSGYQFVEL